jgi:alkaline phosphatase D
MGMNEAKAFSSDDFPEMVPQEAMEILDAGRTWNGGNPPATIRYGSGEVANYCKDRPAQTILGAEQMGWFLERLKSSKATWKIWGNTTATLDMRADPLNLPAGVGKPWPGSGYAGFGGGDHSTAYAAREYTTSFATMESRDSRRSPAIGTVFGRATQRRRCRLRNSSP